MTPDGREPAPGREDPPDQPAGPILVTGATGTLGRPLVERLRAAGREVRAMSRRGEVRADLATGEGLGRAVAGVEVVIHAGSSPIRNTRATDVEGTRRLLHESARAGVRNFIYVSIAGVDRVGGYPYYRVKLRAEELVRSGGVPWTILRATQFFELLPQRMAPVLGALGVILVGRGWQIQPVDVNEVAERLVELSGRPAQGMLPEFGGPEVLTWEGMFRSWRAAGGRASPSSPFRSPAATAAT